MKEKNNKQFANHCNNNNHNSHANNCNNNHNSQINNSSNNSITDEREEYITLVLQIPEYLTEEEKLILEGLKKQISDYIILPPFSYPIQIPKIIPRKDLNQRTRSNINYFKVISETENKIQIKRKAWIFFGSLTSSILSLNSEYFIDTLHSSFIKVDASTTGL